MKYFLSIAFLCFLVVSCSTNENEMNLTGTIKGLKKGTLLLQKLEDTLLVTIDSVMIDGDATFQFSETVESPEIYYLKVRLKDGTLQDDQIAFFAEAGDVNINTSIKNFMVDAVVTGSENQEKLLEYKKLIGRYNDKNLDYMEELLNARIQKNDSAINNLQQKQISIIKSKYFATVNYALNNNDYEVVPYLMLSEIYDANIKYLDTVYKALTPKIKDSKYGKALESFISEREKSKN